jgi:hypothetical protein
MMQWKGHQLVILVPVILMVRVLVNAGLGYINLCENLAENLQMVSSAVKSLHYH